MTVLSPLVLGILAFFAGLLIGSFLNVCIFRLPRDLSVVSPRSFCPECETQIAAWDNIPVLSFLLLGGKCRQCKQKIPWSYPVVELSTGIAFAAAVYSLGLTAAALKMCLFWAILIDLIATDFEERILPDEFTIGGTLVGLLLSAFVPMEFGPVSMFFFHSLSPRWISVLESFVAAAFPCVVIWFVGWLYEKIRHREGLGLGDVKMIAMIGAFLGLRNALGTLILASVVGAIGGVIYVIWTKKEMATYELPFGSFLGFAALFLSAAETLSHIHR
jgi:leader peptidase (prepilin peptidase)/N-methyltransferase